MRADIARSILLSAAVAGAIGLAPPAYARAAAVPSRYAQSAMPLAEALRQFARSTGYDVVFQEELTRGRQSPGVQKARNAHDALTQILAGSGLVPRFTRPDAFILEGERALTPPDIELERIEILSSSEAKAQAYRWYGEKLLQLCLATLRGSSELGTRSYDFVIYLWLSGDGQVIQLEGASESQQAEVLRIAKAMLRGLAVGDAPPVDMPQPVGLRIVAQ